MSTRAERRPRQILALLLLLGAAARTAQAADATDVDALRSAVVDLKLKLIVDGAKKDEIDRLVGLLGDPTADGGGKKEEEQFEGGVAYWDRFKKLLAQSEEIAPALDVQQVQAKKAFEAAERQWRGAQIGKLKFLAEARAVEARLREVEADSQGGAVLEVVGVVLFGLLALAAGLLLAVHERRAGIRRRLRARLNAPTLEAQSSAGRSRIRRRLRAWAEALMTLLLAAVIAAGCSGTGGRAGAAPRGDLAQDERDDLVKQLTELRQGLAALDREIKQAQQKLSLQHEALLRDPTGLLVRPVAEDQERRRLVERFLGVEASNRERLLEILSLARATSALVEGGRDAVAEVRKKQVLLAREAADQPRPVLLRRRILALSGGVVVLCSFALLGIARGSNRVALRRQGKTCPRCLAKNAVKVVPSDVHDDRYPEVRHAECGSCQYEFRELYLPLPRLCFPTVGVSGSGKTHWLLVVYDRIKNSDVPVEATIEQCPSLADVKFDEMIKTTLDERIGIPGTERGLPYPLIFYVRDVDRLGKAATMVNLFDFGGALMDLSIKTDILKRNALLYDGFTLFLDPTQVTGPGIDIQNRQLMEFRNEMREIRDFPPGRPIDVPIAVCVSKLDLLTIKNPLGERAKPWLDELRATADRRLDMAIIQERSDLLARVLPELFPGWHIAKVLRQNFGSRFMFFPLTPVGIVEDEVGQTDLKHRTFAPFGVLEPLLWLLYMHGYNVFERATAPPRGGPGLTKPGPAPEGGPS